MGVHINSVKALKHAGWQASRLLASLFISDAYTTDPYRPFTPHPVGAIEIPVPEGGPGFLTVIQSVDGHGIRASFTGYGDHPTEPGEAAEAPPSAIKPSRLGERG